MLLSANQYRKNNVTASERNFEEEFSKERKFPRPSNSVMCLSCVGWRIKNVLGAREELACSTSPIPEEGCHSNAD